MKVIVNSILLSLLPFKCFCFAPTSTSYDSKILKTAFTKRILPFSSRFLSSEDQEWSGEVVSNGDNGAIKGCSITQVPGSLTTWTISIDGVEADLGKFSEAIYRKITQDAKQQQFQGFRPGTIPPHLQPTYRAFAMDEAAREATLEAMEQNMIRPFDDSRNEILIENVSIPPPVKKSKKKKKSRKKKAASQPMKENLDEQAETVEDAWLTFSTMKEAIDAGWKPGQSFSFVSKNVKGQQFKNGSVTSSGYSPIGSGGSAFDMNAVAAQVASDAQNDDK